MRRGPLAVAVALVLVACAAGTFSPPEKATIDRALELQGDVLADPRFAEVLRELEEGGMIDWSGRLSPAAAEEAVTYPTSAEWLLARFARDGGLPRELLAARGAGRPLVAARATYDPARGVVALDDSALAGGEGALVNTLIHERVHTFGHVHQGRGRAGNKCDAAYLAGDLAEALANREGGAPETARDGAICPALCRVLERRRLGTHSACSGVSELSE